MIGKKINQLATELAPASTDLTIIGNPTTGVSKKITLAQLGAIFSGAVSFYTNYASFPATGTLDVIFCAKDTQKLYLWSGSAYVEVFPSQALLDTYQLRSEKGNANGYASLDSSGKVPVSQLPSSIMEYKGTWSAATNTPTLANGTGDTGDVYICNAAGSVNFGAGSITFAVGDYVIYSGSIWQRSSGAVGTVTSVAASITGNAIGITGSPVTTSGTLAFAFAGTGAQYIKGDGTLATFPTTIEQAKNLITEVYNSTGATLTKGTVVYINGGQGNLPTVTKALATGDTTSAQTFGIVQADITNNNNGFVVIAGKLSDIDTQAYTAGTQLYLSSTTAGAYTSTKQYAPAHLVYVGIIVRSHPTQGVIEVKIQNGYELDELHNVAAQTPTNNDGLFYESSTSLWKNKSLSTILGGSPAYGSGTQNRLTKFTANAGELINSNIHDTGSVIYNNNPSDGQFAWQFNGSQTTGLSYGALIVAGTNASDIALRIQNASSTSEYFFVWGDGRVQINNIPNATTDTDRFLVSDSGVIKYRTGTQLLSDIGGQAAINGTGFVKASGTTISYDNSTYLTTSAAASTYLPLTGGTISGNLSITTLSGVVYADATGQLGTTSGTQDTIAYWGSSRSIASLSTSTYPSLTELSYVKGVTSSIQTQLNAKQNTLTNPVTGTGTTNYLPKFTGTSTIGNSGITDDGTTVTLISRALSGTTASFVSSGKILEVKQSSAGSASYYVFDNTIETSGKKWRFGYTGAVADASTFSLYNETDNVVNFVAKGGNLGLGVTPSAWGSILKAFQLGSYGAFIAGRTDSSGISQVFIGANSYYDGSNWVYANSTFASRYYQADGAHNWQTTASGTAGGSIAWTAAMTLNASGNLSIGNTNDTYKLDVSGEGRFTGRLLVSHSTSGNYGAVIYNTSATGEGLVVRGGSTSSHSAFVVQPYDGSVALFNVLATGAATFSSSVTATSTISTSDGFYSSRSGSDSIASGAYLQLASVGVIQANASNGVDFWTLSGSWQRRMTITQAGNVGIGTTSPAFAGGGGLHINQSGTDTRLHLTNSTTGALSTDGFELALVGNDVYYDSKESAGTHIFYTAGSERMRITSGGNVIINGTSVINSEGLFVKQSSSANLTGICVGYGTSANQFRSMSINSSNVMTFNNGANEATLTAAGAWTNASDLRLKKDIVDIKYGLQTINKTKPRSYKRIDVDGEYIGFVAQELLEIIPEVVSGNADTQYCVDYGSLVAIAFKAIQELNDKIK